LKKKKMFFFEKGGARPAGTKKLWLILGFGVVMRP
jgi:hypothetical protein